MHPLRPGGAAAKPTKPALTCQSVFLLNMLAQASLATTLSKKPDELSLIRFRWFCGKRGIRTPEPFQVNGFQDRRDRPLRHLSERLLTVVFQKPLRNYSKLKEYANFFVFLTTFSSVTTP